MNGNIITVVTDFAGKNPALPMGLDALKIYFTLPPFFLANQINFTPEIAQQWPPFCTQHPVEEVKVENNSS